MSLPVDERLIQMEVNLNQEIKKVEFEKYKLLEQFKDYAFQKYSELGKTFEIKYNLINGSPSIKYADLNIGDVINFEMVSFQYDPKTNIVNGHKKTTFKGKKLLADFNQNITRAGNLFEKQEKESHPLDKTPALDKEKIGLEVQKRVNNILMGILKGELVFSDTEYKRLITTNIALEQELDRLNTRLAAVQIINGSSNIEAEPAKTM